MTHKSYTISDAAVAIILTRLENIAKSQTLMENLLMSLSTESQQMFAELISVVSANTSLVSSLTAVIDRISSEVEVLVAAADVTVPGLPELLANARAQSTALASAVAASTSVAETLDAELSAAVDPAPEPSPVPTPAPEQVADTGPSL